MLIQYYTNAERGINRTALILTKEFPFRHFISSEIELGGNMKGQDILLRRNARRINQEPLAKELGIHPMILTAAEKGYWQPAEEEIERAFRAIDKLAAVGQELSA